jgi:hypothetical protein
MKSRSKTRYLNSWKKQFLVYPVSAVLMNDHIMNVIKPGQHGSTFGNQLPLLLLLLRLK